MSAKFKQIPEMIAAGKSTIEIARQLGSNEKAVRAYAIEQGVFKGVTPTGFWSQERVDLAKKLWTSGVSTTEIGQRLGCSRNAVIGKLTRLGIMGQGSKDGHSQTSAYNARKAMEKRRMAAKRAKAQEAKQRRARAKLAPVIELPPLPETDPEPPGCTSLLDRADNQCRYPYREENFVFCPNERIVGSYCMMHHRIVWRPLPPSKPRHHRSRLQ